jgi:iron complex outermembrane receptor protein
MQVDQDFGSRLSTSLMVLYNELDVNYRDRPGTITANTQVYGPGYTATGFNTGQINPFFMAPAGASGATSEKVSWADLMGNGADGHDYGRDTDNEEAFYGQAGASYKLTDDWEVKLTDAFGVDRDDTGSLNTFCSSCATLALNGTAQTGGSTTSTDVSGQNIVSLNLPLTTANALDVWTPAGPGNRTSALIQKQLYSNNTRSDTQNTFNQLRLEFDGPLFDLPAGAVKFATGGEYVNYHQLAYSNGSLGVGVGSNGATISQFYSRRSVLSAFAEANAPLISADMNVPLVQSLTIDVSARYDKYSDVGPTFNPKYGLDWKINDDVKFRANYSTSFVAAPVGVAGDPSKGGEYGGGASLAPNFNVPIAAFPTVVQLPGCGTPQVASQGYCALGGSTSSPGLSRQYGSALGGAKPQTGNGINLGVDVTPTFLPGFVMNLTYFDQKYKGGVTAPNITQITTIPAFNHLLTLCPNGCTQQQIDGFTRVPEGGTVSGSLPPVIYSLQNHDENNVLNLAIQGIDLDARYDIPTDYGDFHIGEGLTQFFVFDQSVIGSASFSELGTSGINSTFPSVAYHSRSNFGWTDNVIAADLFLNWTAPYRNATNTAVNPTTSDANGNFNGGGDHVSANVTLDMHVSYDFPNGMLQGDQIYLDVQDLTDAQPPFYNGTSKPSEVHSQAGENIFISNPIGRLISLGFRTTF